MSTGGQSASLSRAAAILLVDDNADVGRAMRIAFEVAGYRLDVAGTREEAFSRLTQNRYNAVLLDLNFSPGEIAGAEGLAFLKQLVASDPAACVLVITAHSGIRIAVAAMQAGAQDFVMKPWRNSELLAKVEAAIERKRRSLVEPPLVRPADPALLLGDSAAIQRIRDLIRRLGPTSAGVAITGPSGAGRMLAARALHGISAFASQAPVVIDLRDTAQWTLLAGATGTIILRHIDRLDDLAQARLIGLWPHGVRSIAIAETVRDLTPALRGLAATVEIAIPPLSTRTGDALILARHFLRLSAERHQFALPSLTPAAERLILDQRWADEVRGLALAIEKAVLLAVDGVIDAVALAPRPSITAVPQAASVYDLADNEKAVIAAALRDNHHNVSQTAAALGLSRGALYRRMERYGL